MKEVDSTQRYQTEKTIIDALLKISEIIKKATKSNYHSKKTIGDGDKKQHRYKCDVPIPPPMRTLDSYVSGFSKQYAVSSSNCNQARILLWNSCPYDKRYYSGAQTPRMSNHFHDRNSTRKRHRCDNLSTSSLSDDDHRKGSNKRQRRKYQCHISYDDNQYSASDC